LFQLNTPPQTSLLGVCIGIAAQLLALFFVARLQTMRCVGWLFAGDLLRADWMMGLRLKYYEWQQMAHEMRVQCCMARVVELRENLAIKKFLHTRYLKKVEQVLKPLDSILMAMPVVVPQCGIAGKIEPQNRLAMIWWGGNGDG
jgi:hypothetical protein